MKGLKKSAPRMSILRYRKVGRVRENNLRIGRNLRCAKQFAFQVRREVEENLCNFRPLPPIEWELNVYVPT